MCVAERSGAFDMQISGAAIRIRVPPEKVLRSTSRVPHVGTRVQEHPVEIFQVYRAAFVFPCFDQQRFNAPVIFGTHVQQGPRQVPGLSHGFYGPRPRISRFLTLPLTQEC